MTGLDALSRGIDWATWAILGLTLTFISVLGLPTSYVLDLIGLALLVVVVWRRGVPNAWSGRAARMLLAAFAILAVCFAVTADEPRDVASAVNFIALVLFGPVEAALASAARPGNLRRVAMLALCGTAIALAVILFRIFVLHLQRGDSHILGVIELSNTAMVLGFLSLAGLMTGPRRDWYFWLGPIMGTAVALLTQSRGPLVAVIPLVAVSGAFLWPVLTWRSRAVAAVSLVLALIALGVVILSQDRLSALPGIVTSLGEGTDVADVTSGIRLALWEGAWHAFLERPWLGYGWHNMMDAVQPFLTPEYVTMSVGLPQLHNDVADFAVAAGVVGIGVYLLIIAAPVAGAFATARDTQFRARLFGAAVLTTAYIGGGLTNLMFGFEFHTAFFVFLLAILLGYCRDEPAPALT